MRNIKFRVWNKDSKEYVSNENEQSDTRLNYDTNYLVSWHVYELEQYTGLKDKNGKEIYEGNVCKIYENKKSMSTKAGQCIKENSIISFENSSFCYNVEVMGRSDVNMFLGMLKSEDIEIIGNIHENPELLC